MKQTRMRMSKEAASLIHEYRGGHGHKTNTDAVYGLIRDLDVANCNEVFMSKRIAELESENARLNAGYRTLKSQTATMTEKLKQKDAHIKRINGELSRRRHLCDELQKYVIRLRRENYSLVMESNKKPSGTQHLLWRVFAATGWIYLLTYAAVDAWSALS